jgi:hypothetical protein
VILVIPPKLDVTKDGTRFVSIGIQQWFPTELQEVLEMLMFQKSLDGDVGGLLSWIMFAGLDFDDDNVSKCK